MKRIITLVLTLAISVSLFIVPTQAAWYDKYTDFAKENHLIEDYEDPHELIDRGTAICMICRVYNSYDYLGYNINLSKAKLWAMKNNISDCMDLNGYISRGMLVTMLYRCEGNPMSCKSLDVDYSKFSDLEIDKYYADAMIWAVTEGIINGYPDGTVRPWAQPTLAEICTMLYKFCYIDRSYEALCNDLHVYDLINYRSEIYYSSEYDYMRSPEGSTFFFENN